MKRVSVFLIALVVLLAGATASMLGSYYTIVRAETSGTWQSFDERPVIDDLNEATIDGKKFKTADYPIKQGQPMQFLQFIEYCYSPDPSNQQDYSLFLYVYNPSLSSINTSSQLNRIQMARDYVGDKPVVYDKYLLSYCNDYNRLFYKFEILFTPSQRTQILNRLDAIERRYDAPGFELFINGNQNATDNKIARTIFATGYALGYGLDNTVSNLAIRMQGMETVSLDVKHTEYRTLTSDAGAGFQNQINSVYFSVPNYFINAYGRLQKILAEWWEYKTAPIIVTKDQTVYDNLYPAIGQYVEDTTKYYGLYLNPQSIPFNLFWKFNTWGNWCFNDNRGGLFPNQMSQIDYYLYYLFKVNLIEQNNGGVLKGDISSDTLQDYIYSYNKSYNKGSFTTKNGQISKDLFIDKIDEVRENAGIKRGYNVVEFDADDALSYSTYWDNNPSYWQQVKDFGWWNATFRAKDLVGKNEIGRDNILTIYPLEDSDIVGNISTISDNLLVHRNDVSALKEYYQNAKANNETTFLFRFAQTEFFADWVEVHRPWNPFDLTNVAYYAQETVFLDFDIIQLTFSKDGVYTVIACVSNPLDIVAEITPPTTPKPFDINDIIPAIKNAWWWVKYFILGAIVVIVLAVITMTVRFLKKMFKPRKTSYWHSRKKRRH